MLETILAISTIIGGIAAIDYFWGKWGISVYILKIAQGLLNKFLSKPSVWKEFESTVPLESPSYVKRPPIESDWPVYYLLSGPLREIST